MKKIFCLLLISATTLAGRTGWKPFFGRDDKIFEMNRLETRIYDAQIHLPSAPVIAFPAPEISLSSGNITVSGTASRDSTSVMLRMDGGPWQTATGVLSWQCVFTGLGNGRHTVEVKALNEDGEGPVASVTFGVIFLMETARSLTEAPATNISFSEVWVHDPCH